MRHAITTLAAALALTLAGAGAALAQDADTGTDTDACATATAAAIEVENDADTTRDAALNIDGIDEGDLTNGEIERLTIVRDEGGEFAATAATKLAVLLPAVDAQLALAAAVDNRDTACADGTDDEQPAAGEQCSTDTIPTGITNRDGDCIGGAIEPDGAVEQNTGLDDDDDERAGQVDELPRGGVDTGGGPLR